MNEQSPKLSDMRFLLVITLLFFPALSHAEDDCPLQGKWKSDAARTLADVASRGTFDGDEKNAASQDLFGHVIHHWTCTGFRAYSGDSDDSDPTDAVPYRVHNRNADSFIVTISGQTECEMNISFEGECYKVLNPGRQFYEYFCPI